MEIKKNTLVLLKREKNSPSGVPCLVTELDGNECRVKDRTRTKVWTEKTNLAFLVQTNGRVKSVQKAIALHHKKIIKRLVEYLVSSPNILQQ